MDIEYQVEKARQGDIAAMEQLCLQFSGLMKKAAYQRHLRMVGDDAAAVAYLAFIEAVKNYVPRKNVPFAGYAKSKVQFAVWNFFKRECKRWRNESSAAGEEREDMDFIGQLPDTADIAKEVETKEIIRRAIGHIKSLPDKQRQVIVALFFQELSLTQTASRLGITVQAVYGLKKRAIKLLKAHKDLADL